MIVTRKYCDFCQLGIKKLENINMKKMSLVWYENQGILKQLDMDLCEDCFKVKLNEFKSKKEVRT